MINWILAGLIVGICVLLVLYATLPRLVWNWKHCRWFAKGTTGAMSVSEDTVVSLFDSLEQRVTALEEFERATTTMVERHERRLNRVAEELTEHLKAATPSPPTASPTTDSPSDALVPGVTIPTDPTSWPSDQQIMDAGLVTRVYESAEE